MLHLRRILIITSIAFALLQPGAHRVRAQETSAPSSPTDPAAPPPVATQGEIVDLSGEAMVSPAPAAPPPAPAATAEAPSPSSLPSPRLMPIAAPPAVAFRANSVHLSLLGLLGRFRLNYERRLTEHHGLVIEAILNPNLLDRLSPDTDDASDPKRFFGYGAGAGYRWHWRGEEGGFVSAMVALEHGSGSSPVLGDPDIRWSGTRTMLSMTPAVGGRWIWGSGFSLVVRGGLGYAYYWVDSDPGVAKKARDQNENQFLNLEGEVSLGYVF